MLTLGLDATQMGLAAGAEALGVVVQGSVGFGLNVVAAPLLLLIDTRFVPVPSLVMGLIVTFSTATRERVSIDRGPLTWALAGRLPGTITGALALFILSRRDTEAVFGLVVLAAVVFSVAGWQLNRKRSTIMAIGILSGFMGTTAAIGGPPLALAYQRESGPKVRGTLSAFGFGGTVLSLCILAMFGELGIRDLQLAAVLLPGLVVGYTISRHIGSRLNGPWMQPAVLAIVALSGLVVLAESLGGFR